MKEYNKHIFITCVGLFLLALGYVVGQWTADRRWEATVAVDAAVAIAGLTPALAKLHEGKTAESQELLNVQLDRNLGILAKYQYRIADPEELKRHNFFLNYLFAVWQEHPPFRNKGYSEIADWTEIRSRNDSFLKRSADAHQLERKSKQ